MFRGRSRPGGMKKISKRLAVSRATLRTLTSSELGGAAGGTGTVAASGINPLPPPGSVLPPTGTGNYLYYYNYNFYRY